MTNHEKWKSFLSSLSSPDIYIDFGWYSLISSALQRRVFYGPEHMPLYLNQYITLVGPPATGKGLVLKQVLGVLKELKRPERKKIDDGISAVDRQIIESLAKIDFDTAQEEEARGAVGGKKGAYERPLLIPIAADATTYEALVSAMARNVQRIDFRRFDEELKREVTDIYTHCSTSFNLEELSSLLRRHADDVVQFLMVGFDCGDYKKDTKTQTVDRVYRMCINFLAGTTPSFMQRTFTDGLLNEGFSSRSLFIFASRPRNFNTEFPELTDEQKQHRKDVVEHVRTLASLYGKIVMTEDAKKFLQEWWIAQQQTRVNLSDKLIHYYGRKVIHVKKLAAAIHFGETRSLEIGVEDIVKAIDVLNPVEKVMHHALVYNTNNPLYKPGTKILTYLELNESGATLKELYALFYEDIDQKQMDSILEHYLTVGKITTVNSNGKTRYLLIKEAKI